MAASNPGVALYILKPNMPFLRFHLNYSKWREVSGSKWREKRKSQRMKKPSGSIHGAKEILIFEYHLSRATWSFFFLHLNTLPQVLPSHLLYQMAKTPRAHRKTTGPSITWMAKCYFRTDWTMVKANIRLQFGVPWMQETPSLLLTCSFLALLSTSFKTKPEICCTTTHAAAGQWPWTSLHGSTGVKWRKSS